MSKKPANTLTQLEEEPESGFLGCTYTEISNALKRSLIVTAMATLVITLLIRWEIAAVIGMICGGINFRYVTLNYSKNRSDKPLYYHKHLATHRTALFIRPARAYQRERNG